MPPVHVRVWHSVSFPGQSLGTAHGIIVVVPVPVLIVAPVLDPPPEPELVDTVSGP